MTRLRRPARSFGSKEHAVRKREHGQYGEPHRLYFANEIVSSESHGFGYVVPTLASNENVEPGWVQITPFGKFPHPKGLQIVNKDDSDVMVKEFSSLANAAHRTFFGTPFFIGHPDVPELQGKYKDHEPKGRIKEMETRHDAECYQCNQFQNDTSEFPCHEHGLFARVKWNENGKRLIQNEAFEGHSPYWKLQERSDGFHPVWLKSVGFTNEPNIPVKTITSANEKPMAKKTTLISYINELLGANYPDDDSGASEAANAIGAWRTKMANDFDDLKKQHDELKEKNSAMTNDMSNMAKRFGCNEAVEPAVKALKDAGFAVPEENVVVFVANELTTTRTNATKTEADLKAANERASGLASTFANERKVRAENVLEVLFRGGFVGKKDRDDLAKEFANETTYDATMVKCLAMRPKYSVFTQVGKLGNVDTEVKSQTALQTELADMANEIFEKANEAGLKKISFVDAWAKASSSARGKEILQLMTAKKTK